MHKLSASGFNLTKLDALLVKMLDATFNIHGILIERHGQVVAEGYHRDSDRSIYSLLPRTRMFDSSTLHDTRSVGKSLISLLLGILLEQGKIRSIDMPVMDFYPKYADLITPGLSDITLEHLLTMSSGFVWQEGNGFPDNEHHLYWKKSPCRYVLSREIVDIPGKKFNYNSGGTAVLADILTRAAKTPWSELARRLLFEPLEIYNWEWIADLHRRPMAFTGLRLSAGDMAKIGRLVLNQGCWHEQQIVPADWITKSLQPRISTEYDELQYGYHWWVGNVSRNGKKLAWAGAFGNGGQRIYVVPELDMALVIIAGAYGDPRISRAVHGFFKDLIQTVIS